MSQKSYAGLKCESCETEFGVSEETIDEEETLTCPVCEAGVDTREGTDAFANRNPEDDDDDDDEGGETEEEEDEEVWS